LVNDDQGEVTDQRAEDWFKWYDWYPTFVREREAGRKAEEARRDARVAAKEPGWKVLLD
jgi:glutathionylspermidine synthase